MSPFLSPRRFGVVSRPRSFPFRARSLRSEPSLPGGGLGVAPAPPRVYERARAARSSPPSGRGGSRACRLRRPRGADQGFEVAPSPPSSSVEASAGVSASRGGKGPGAGGFPAARWGCGAPVRRRAGSRASGVGRARTGAGPASWTVLAAPPSSRAAASAGTQQPAQNWYGPGESDCLIKTEHCDVRSRGADAM